MDMGLIRSTLRGILYSPPHLCHLLTGIFGCQLNAINVHPREQGFHKEQVKTPLLKHIRQCEIRVMKQN